MKGIHNINFDSNSIDGIRYDSSVDMFNAMVEDMDISEIDQIYESYIKKRLPADKEWITIYKISTISGLTVSKIQEYLIKNNIPTCIVGHFVFVDYYSIEDFLSQHVSKNQKN